MFWLLRARQKQLTPKGDWFIWLILAGRGWGKTETGAQDLAYYALTHPGSQLAVIAPTSASARDVCVEGKTGLLKAIPPERLETWNRSIGELALTNKARIRLFSSEEPDRLRGWNIERAWCDELAAWADLETWNQLMYTMREITDPQPQVIVTTTPRPIALIRDLVKRDNVKLTRGNTFENRENLAPSYIAELEERLVGTRSGRQEIDAEILEDNPSALFSRDQIDQSRVRAYPQLRKVVVGVDPSGGTGDENDEQGIVIAGVDVEGHDAYVLADYSCKRSPLEWAHRAITAYHEYLADYIVAEANFGGDMVKHTIKMADPGVPVRMVSASRGKAVRAQPVADLYQQGRVHHLGSLPKLEDEQCEWDPDGRGPSPNRLDALVWAMSELIVAAREPRARAI
jgi:phage terminase large subunit-like protein